MSWDLDSMEASFFNSSNSIFSEFFNEAHNLELDSYDKRLFNNLRDESSKLKELEKSGSHLAHFPELMNDVWGVFYKSLPTLRPEEMIKPSCKVNRRFVEKMLEDTETEKARIYTMLDELSSAISTLNTVQKFLQELNSRPELKKATDLANQSHEAEQEGNQELAEQLADQAEQQLQGAARDVRRAMKLAVEAGNQKVEEALQVLNSWGLEPADLARMPIGESLQLIERLTEYRLKYLADLVGRMRNPARAKQKEKLKKIRDELHGITIGANLENVLPSELVALKHPLLKKVFFRKMSERQLLQYELIKNESQGRGPIVGLVDVSYSMNGTKLNWAIAVLMGLLDTALRQKRRAAFIFFNAAIVHRVAFAPGEKDPRKLIDMATVGASGGTAYEPPLTEAVELIETSDFEKADIVMITDGECLLAEDFLKNFLAVKTTKKFRCWSVVIASRMPPQMNLWSDRAWLIHDLTKPDLDEVVNVAGSVFQEVY